jgi:hypothetical protein
VDGFNDNLKEKSREEARGLDNMPSQTQGTHSATTAASILMPFSINDDFEEFESNPHSDGSKGFSFTGDFIDLNAIFTKLLIQLDLHSSTSDPLV